MKEWFIDLWNKITTFFSNNLNNIITFFALLVIGIIVIGIIMRLIKKSFKRHDTDPMSAKFFVELIRFCLYLVFVLILLHTMGVAITGFVTALSALVLAIGMALKENIANLVNGLIIITTKKYKQGEYIVCENVEGQIVDINFLFSTLKTLDGKQVTLPNSHLVNYPVTNFGAYPKRRVQYEIPVAYESDIELVQKVVLDSIKACNLAYIDDPKPGCRLKKFDASAIVFFVTFWVDNQDYWEAYFTVLEYIYNEFKRNHIVIPYQQIEIRQRTDDVKYKVIDDLLPKRVEKYRTTQNKKIDIDDIEDMSFKDIKRYIKNKEKSKQKIEKVITKK